MTIRIMKIIMITVIMMQMIMIRKIITITIILMK